MRSALTMPPASSPHSVAYLPLIENGLHVSVLAPNSFLDFPFHTCSSDPYVASEAPNINPVLLCLSSSFDLKVLTDLYASKPVFQACLIFCNLLNLRAKAYLDEYSVFCASFSFSGLGLTSPGFRFGHKPSIPTNEPRVANPRVRSSYLVNITSWPILH